jgi:DNA repair exonuclease SbcCD ATPase subunit
MSTDFFDDDLLRASNTRHEGSDENDAIHVQPILGATLGKMARKKEDMSNQAASAVQEIERLRLKQEELEREKSALEELARRQDQYERDKTDILEKLDRSVVAMEREESQAARMVELLSESRNRFKNTLAEIRAINEDLWGDHNFLDELNRSAALVETARMDYKKALAKIEAANWHVGVEDGSDKATLDALGFESGGEKDFGHWLKIGFAVTLPLMALIVLILGMYLLMHKGG